MLAVARRLHACEREERRPGRGVAVRPEDRIDWSGVG